MTGRTGAITPYFRITVTADVMCADGTPFTGPSGERFIAECDELGLSAWGRTDVNAEQNLSEKIRERFIEVMQHAVSRDRLIEGLRKDD